MTVQTKLKSWSRYNTLFHVERSGSFLYNALSNVMLELDDEHVLTAERLRDERHDERLDKEGEFLAFLEEKGFLVHEEDEIGQLMQMRHQRTATCFSTTEIGLTICPTLACNFGCPYCFEQSQNDATVMSAETMDAVAYFIAKHQDARHLSVSWYGGEPTIAFDVIKTLTSRFLELYPDYGKASLVTNGYLLNKEKIDQLDELRITSLQITLDGGEATHNSRRMLKGGGPTYHKILHNIDLLMRSPWKGTCTIRINVDKTNQHEYASLRSELLERYRGKKLTVYPGRVKTFVDLPYDDRCVHCNPDWVGFTIDGYKNDGIVPEGGFYPKSRTHNMCIATSLYGYVIGPKGELYKCWEDVGKMHMVIGSVHDDAPIGNQELVARYSIGTDPYNTDGCAACPVLPICGGGCVNKRLRAQQFHEPGVDYCLGLSESLVTYLEAYLDTRQTKEICAALLGKECGPTMEKGYRMVQP